VSVGFPKSLADVDQGFVQSGSRIAAAILFHRRHSLSESVRSLLVRAFTGAGKSSPTLADQLKALRNHLPKATWTQYEPVN
jgi:hypothetical protein